MQRAVKGIFEGRADSLISVRVECEMLDFDAVRCELFYAHEACSQ